MKKLISKLVLSAGAVVALTLTASNADAQNYYRGSGGYNNNSYGGYNNNSYSGYNNNGYSGNSGYNRGGTDTYATLGQNVGALNRYGSQMTQAYRAELGNYGGCRNSAALYSEMRRYNAYTGNLATAYRGTCPKAFNRASANVHNSLTRIRSLRKNARVSNQVCGYITQSYPMAAYVQSNGSAFRPYGTPVPQRGGYGTRPAYGYQTATYSRDSGGFNWGSALIGAIAGRIIHGAVSH